MGKLGYFLPEGWGPLFGAEDGIYEYDHEGFHCNVQLTTNFEFVFTWYTTPPTEFFLPYTVIFAMYLDRGVYGLKPQEAQAVAILTEQRDKAQEHIRQLNLERLAFVATEKNLRERLANEKGRRKKLAAKCDDLRNENRVYKSRVCTQRGVIGDLNQQLRAALQRKEEP